MRRTACARRATADVRCGIRQGLRAFARDETGVTAVVYAFSFTAFLMSAAIAIDYGLAVTEKSREQFAVDAAALAASQHVGAEDQETAIPAAAEAFYDQNKWQHGGSRLTGSSFDPATSEISASSGASMRTTLSRMKGIERASLDVAARATVVKGTGSMEVALVLDNSGSMGGSSGSVHGTYIEDLKAAASGLASNLFAGAEGTDRVKFGLVPFAASVNVGAVNRGAAWIDNDGQSSIHFQNFSANRSRFSIFDDMGVAWKGCVETRPGALDVSDVPSESSNPDTLFVPMMAPDEPDDSNASAAGVSRYPNNYISDYGGTCPAPEQVCVTFNKKKGACTSWAPAPLPVAEAQSRTCKYQGATPSADTGPNAGCTTAPILPLNSTKDDVLDAIAAMTASGNTNIGEGVMWGWRVLSPGTPFTEGRQKADAQNRKFMIVMTDGENFLSSNTTHNKSVYGAHGYAAKGRLGGTYSQAGYTAHLDGKLVAACAAAKREGITIFTVAFRLETNPNTQALLRGCATTPDQAFSAGDGDGLLQSFKNIGRQISQTRIAH